MTRSAARRRVALDARARGRHALAQCGAAGACAARRLRRRRTALRRARVRRVAGRGGRDGPAAAAAARVARGAARRAAAPRDAARRRRRLRRHRAPDWALVQPAAARGSVYAVTSDNVSVAAGRLPFALGLQGLQHHRHGVLVGGGRGSRRRRALRAAGARCALSLGVSPADAARHARRGGGGDAVGRRAVQDARRARQRLRALGGRRRARAAGGVGGARRRRCAAARVGQDGAERGLTAPNGWRSARCCAPRSAARL